MIETVDIGVSNVYKRLVGSKAKIRVLEGGSGSSKTWSVIQWIIRYCHLHQYQGKRVLITRQKLTWLKLSVLDDFQKILTKMQIYDKRLFNKSDSIYHLFGNTIYFTGLDEPQKVHGPRWDVFWGNEAIELAYDDCRQVMMRTNDFILLDYNPKLTDHWIYNRIITREDCIFMKSTQLDNPFLPKEQRKEILSYEPTQFNISQGTADQTYWEIYGLGKRANIQGVIFPNVKYVQDFPKDPEWQVYGLDFGYSNDPTAVVKVALHIGELWFDELIYRTGLVTVPIEDQNGEIQDNINDELELSGIRKNHDEIYADSAASVQIQELLLSGWDVWGVKKGPGSVLDGIEILKRYKINITERSLKFKKEAQNYKWMMDPHDKEGKTYLNKPVDRFNHCFDAVRYVAMHKIGSPDDFFMEAMN